MTLNKLKWTLIIVLLILMIFSINIVSAMDYGEVNNVSTTVMDSSQEITAFNDNFVLDDSNSNTIYVSKEGSDSNDGLTKDKSLASLTHALNIVPNNGSIILLDGSYSYSSISILSSKIVTIEGGGNVNLTGGNSYNSFITNDGILTLKNINVVNCKGEYTDAAIVNKNVLYVLNSTFNNNKLVFYNLGDLIINNSNFLNSLNTVVYADENTKTTTVINSRFINGKSAGSILSFSDSKYSTLIENCTFENIYSTTNAGGIIGVSNSGADFRINNCRFINNTLDAKGMFTQTSDKYGVVIRVGLTTDVLFEITKSVFVNNKGINGAIGVIQQVNSYINVTHSIFLNNTDYNGNTIVNGASRGTSIYDYNWWGIDNPDFGVLVNDAKNKINNWVILNMNYVPSTNIVAGSNIKVISGLTKYKDVNGNIGSLIEKLPDYGNITFEFQDGFKKIVAIENGLAKLDYVVKSGENIVYSILDNQKANITIVAKELDIIYVSENGDDSNEGSELSPVKTIAVAIKLTTTGKIIILPGKYMENNLNIDKNLNITGRGNVIIDGKTSGTIFTFNSGIMVYLNNLNINNAFKNGYGGVIYNNGANLYLNSINFYGNSATNGGAAIYNTNKGSITIFNSKFYNNTNTVSSGWNKGGSAIYNTDSSKVIIENSEFYLNNAAGDGTIQSYGGDLTIKSSKFFNNTAKCGSVIYTENSKVLVDNCEFYDNIANNAVIYARTSTLNITNSIIRENYAKNCPAVIQNLGSNIIIDNNTIVNNKGTRAIIINQDLSSSSAVLNIINSRIYNNTVLVDSTVYGIIYNDKSSSNNNITLNINNCAIFNNNVPNNMIIQHGDLTSNIYVNANFNWWGSNKDPLSLVCSGVILDSWIILQVNYEDKGIPVLYDVIDIEANLNHYITRNGKNGTIANNHAFDGLTVNFSTVTGYLTKNNPIINNGVATSKYSVLTSSNNIIFIKFDNETITLNLNSNYYNGTTYVSVDGKDTNDGSINSPVASLEKAIAINKNGNIIIIKGTYIVMDVKIDGTYNITGNGDVTLSGGDVSRVLYILGGKVIIKNINFSNGRTLSESGALIGNAGDLTLINTTFTNSKSNKNGGAIYSVGNLTIINSTIANNKATIGGAIFIDKFNDDYVNIKFQNVIFENNVATGENKHGGGAIYAQAIGGTVLIDNCSFISNSVSGNFAGGAIYSLQLVNRMKIINSKFINNSANSPENYGGGAICFIGGNLETIGKLDIINSLFEDNIDSIAGGIYIRASTLDISNSILINNSKFSIYKGITSYATTKITADNNWWGTNEGAVNFVSGVDVTKWIIMTFINNTPIIQGNTVILTVALDTLNDGSKLNNPLLFSRPVSIITPTKTYNNQYTIEYLVVDKITIISAIIDNQIIYLSSDKLNTTLEISDVIVNLGRDIDLIANVKDINKVNVNIGFVEFYVNGKLVGTSEVKNGLATLTLSNNYSKGNYTILAKYVDVNNVYYQSMNKSVLKVISTSLIVTNSTFFDFFDVNGLLKEEITANELIFSGSFINLGLNTITIDRSMTIKGVNSATLNNIYLELLGNNISVDNFTININKQDYGIYVVNCGNIIIKNSLINFNDSGISDTIAIYCDKVNELQLINNSINYLGQSKGKTINHPVHISNCDNAIIDNNIINAKMPSLAIDYDRVTYEAITYSVALFVDKSDNIKILNNKITNSYNAFSGMYDTIEGIIIKASKNPVIKFNVIDVTGHNYTYALKFVSVMDSEFNVYGCLNIDCANNIITSKCDSYYANAIELDGPISGRVYNNSIVVEALSVVYGIYSQAINGAVNLDYINNTIIANSHTVYGMELMGTDEFVSGNNITAKGNITMGIISSSKNLEVTNNIINSLGSGIGTITGGDILGGENTGILITADKNSAKYSKLNAYKNKIITTGDYTIMIDKRNIMVNIVEDNYLVSSKLLGDKSVYTTSKLNKIFNNTPSEYMTVITVKNNELIIGDNYTITLTDFNGTGLDGMEVIIKCGGYVWKKITDKFGKINIPASKLGIGNHLVEVIFEGNGYYAASKISNNVTINKIPVDIDLICDDVFVGSDLIISAEITGGANGDIIFVINNKEYIVPIINNKAKLSLNNLVTGKYEVIAKYEGNELYESTTVSATFNINKYSSDIKTNITVEDNTVIIEVILPKDATGNVTAVIGDKHYSIDIKDGVGKLLISNLAGGNYTVTIYYSGDNKYNSFKLDQDIIIIPLEFKLDVNELIKFYGNSDKLTAILLDSQGNPIINVSIVFTVNNIKYTRLTNGDGIASMNINLNPGVYKVSASYNNTIVNSTVTVKSVVVGDDIVKMFRNGTQYYALFLDSNGNPLINTAVKFNINGVFYYRNTTNEGVARLNINLRPGEYIITNYNLVTGEENSNKVVVKPLIAENYDLVKYFQNESQFSVKIIGKDGKIVTGEEVNFNINGVFYKRVTDENGIATLKINLRPGNYIITSEHEGYAIANNITVLPTLKTTDLSMNYKDGSTFNAIALDKQGNPLANQKITFNVNGVFYNKITDENGVAKLNINLNKGQYIITSIWDDYMVGNKITIA